MKCIDVPVSIVFFNRYEPLKEVFDAVRKARPSKLFLIQDGARAEKINDLEDILKCREIVSKIDWPCEVFKNYSKENFGCGQRVKSGLDWVFEHVDRTIILEDDCVPSQAFFPFCEELLEKYKNDDRVSQICGMNHLGIYEDTEDSYFYSNTGSCWGWATWKRTWDLMEYSMPYIEDQQLMDIFKANYLMQKNNKGNEYYNHGKRLRKALKDNKRLSAWTYQFNMTKYLYSQFNIVSKYNMINNIGMTEDSTHTASSYNLLPSGIRDVYFMKTYEIKFPLKHPKYSIVDDRYEELVNYMMGIGFWRSKIKKIEYLVRKLIYNGK